MPDDDTQAATLRNGHEHGLGVQERVRAEEQLAAVLYDHPGEWVAVENHRLIAFSPDLDTLIGRLNGQRATAEVFRVEDPAACP